MDKHHLNNNTPFHFSFLRDATTPGFYISDFKNCFSKYPFLISQHKFDFYSLAYFIKGEGTFHINNKSFKIKPNRIFLCPQNIAHAFRFSKTPEGVYTFVCQDFYAAEFNMIRLMYLFSYALPIANKEPIYYIDLPEKNTEIAHMFHTLLLESNSKQLHHAPIIRSYLNILILKLTDICESYNNNKSDETNAIIIKLSYLIESNYSKQTSSHFYAQSLQVSLARLNSICKNVFNMSLKKIIQQRIMIEIRKLLEETDISVAEIAFKFNFSDDSYFNKVFKSHTHLSPGKYRELHQKMKKRFL